MRRSCSTISRTLPIRVVITSALLCGAAVVIAQTDVTKLKNPVAADAASVAAGRKLFAANCSSCHGDVGKGDGKSAAALNPKPPDLTDAAWKHGASDGELFTLIREGAKQTSMRGYAGRMTTQELWSLVNYLRTLGPKTSKSQ